MEQRALRKKMQQQAREHTGRRREMWELKGLDLILGSTAVAGRMKGMGPDGMNF